MNELDPIILFYVFQEMLGTPLLVALLLIIVVGTLAFVSLLVREKGVIASRMIRSQMLGVLGGVLALVLMARVSSSGFTDAGGPADWFLIALVFGCGLVGTTAIAYGVSGWLRVIR